MPALRRLVPALAGLLGLFAAASGLAAADEAAAGSLPPAAETEFFAPPARIVPLVLSQRFLVPGSVRVTVDGEVWREGVDYRVRGRSGEISPLHEWAAAGERAFVRVDYRYLPLPAAPRRDLRPMLPAPPKRSSAGDGTGGVTPTGVAATDFGGLQVSGSKTVQVSSGSRREMTVDQNLRLSVLGQLTPDIAVRAFLSDDNLPVVPEGNTEELRDIDKVLVELTGRSWRATLGDFVAERRGTAFGDYRRKLQGVSVEVTPGRSSVEALAGSPRGRYRTVEFQGQETNQGPYYLGGGASAGNLFVVAGSERVTLDGELLTRGENRDYVVDYVLGTVTFTYRRLITAESRIVVEFEEGEGAYGRTVVGAGAGQGFTVPGLGWDGHFQVRVIRENEDPSRLRTGELGPEDEAVLSAAGDDENAAVAAGVFPTAPGEGAYLEDDAGGVTIYVHAPGGGDFDIVFRYVGPGAGDYRLERLSETGERIYAYAGDGQGSYRIGRTLPLPERHSVATLGAALGDTAGSHLSLEWNASTLDRNQLSDLDDGDNGGQAARAAARVRDRALRLGGRSLGRLDVAASWEDRREGFRPFQSRKTLLDYVPWGLESRARRVGFLDEADRERAAQMRWSLGSQGRTVSATGRLADLEHGPGITADQRSGELQWQLAGGRGRHSWQTANSFDALDPLDVQRDRRLHEASWRLGPVVPSARHERRSWRDDAVPAGRAAGFRFDETRLALSGAPGTALVWRTEFRRGLADSLVDGAWRRERDSRTATAAVTTGQFGGMRLVGEGTVRRILQPDGPEQTTRLARIDLSGRWDRTASDWSLGYGVDNSRTEVLDRQIVFVGDRQGSFNEDGEFVGEDQGGYDMVLAGTDSLIATTAVRADVNWRQGFRFLGADRWYGSWSLFTLAAVEGRSTADDVGRLLRLDPGAVFDDEAAVLGDLRFSEELTLLQHLRRVDLRGKFDFRETRDRQFADHPEDRLSRTWQATSTVNVSRRASLRLRWLQQEERRLTAETAAGARRSQALATHRYELGWNLTPSPDLRLGLQGEHVRRRDAVSRVEQRENALRPTARGRLARRWTVQADWRWSRVTSEEPAGAVRPVLFPYPGTNVESLLRVTWEPSPLLTVAVGWFGRLQGERGWQHDVRLESTARF